MTMFISWKKNTFLIIPSYLLLLDLWPSNRATMSMRTGIMPELNTRKIIGDM